MPRFNLKRLYDPSFDREPPLLLRRDGAGFWVRAANSSQVIRIPIKMTGRLAYLIGVVLGDSYLSKPIARMSHGPGFHWKVVVTGPRGYVVELRKLFVEVFGVHGGLRKDRRKRDSWQLRFGNIILHRFFRRILRMSWGRKTTHRRWSGFELVSEYPFHFMWGLIDSDGYVGGHYIGIVQKSVLFLRRVQDFAEKTTGLRFTGPNVNKRRTGRVTSWIIAVHKKKERAVLLSAKKQVGRELRLEGPHK